MFRTRSIRIAVALCLIPASLAITSVATASGGTFSGPSSSIPSGTVKYGPGTTSGPTPDTTWSCAVTMSNTSFHPLVGTYGAVVVYGAQACAGTGYAAQRVGSSIWDEYNGILVAGWNYSLWSSTNSSDSESVLHCTNNTDSFEFIGIAEGYAVSGAQTQYVQSLDGGIHACGY